jgi:hypothetical protein
VPQIVEPLARQTGPLEDGLKLSGHIARVVLDELSAFSLGDLRPIDEVVLRTRSRQAPAVTEGPGGKLEATRARTTYRWYRAMLHREPPAD